MPPLSKIVNFVGIFSSEHYMKDNRPDWGGPSHTASEDDMKGLFGNEMAYKGDNDLDGFVV